MTLDDLVAKVTDPYERQARLYPALLALLPLLTVVVLLYGAKATALSGALTVAVSCGCLYMTTNLCREMGMWLEKRLYREWGGKPTTQLLRHRDKTIEGITKRRYHAFLATKINAVFPDQKQEALDPEGADEIYQSGIRWLLDHTRPDDGKKFDMIFRENIAYGFRRNALGMKPIGLLISISSALWTLKVAGVLFGRVHKPVDVGALSQMPEPAIASLVISSVMTVAWLFFFTKRSTRTAAFTYAETLLRACDSL